ncbi:ferredoxin [Candidatus Gribaldobacteria bacterium]|nr:ferredoxin [Candidatus Gribaldobacteria bacterium]
MQITLNRLKCIGCGACSTVCPDVFKITNDGKSSLKDVELKDLQAIESEIACAKEAAGICPVKCIQIS